MSVVMCASCGQQNPEGARFCNSCASPLEVEERPLREERKTVTVVFVDLVGFTAHSEQLDPEDVRGLLAPYHARVREELERRGGTVEKFIGDAVMAVFGAPSAHEDDPERAVRAALAIRDWSGGQSDLQVRVAVNTGEALVNVGARPAEGEAMVAGDVVNTAARIQAAAPVNGVLVGEVTYRATRDQITYRDSVAVEAKGKSEPVLVWEAVEPLARVGVDLPEQVKTPLVGRARELELVRSVLGRVRDERATQLVTLVGVPGIGKSRLVLELLRLVDDEPELMTWRQGRCLPYGESVTFWALGEIVKAEAGILESDSPGEAERKLDRVVTTLVSDSREARWLQTELRALVGLGGDGGGSQTAGAAWRRFLEAVAERGPAVLVFEDLHWADDGLLDFLDELVDWLRDAPLLVMATARPELLERRPAWGGGKPNATTISLQPLPEEDTVRLISALLERPLQLADEQRTLLDRAGGNPLFAEQYVRMLSERGTAGELPESVQGVIAARLDALPRAEKELMQEASVHGKVFWVGGVAAAMGVDAAGTEPLLRALERKDFVRRERRSTVAGDTQYSFQHVLLRDVAYGQIPRRARADKHLRAAEWMERLGRPEDHAELLAYHYQQALELGRAVGAEDDPVLVEHARDALRTAGERALALSAYASAAEFFADAIALSAPADPARARILLERGHALLALGGPGLELATEALEGFVATGDIEGQAEAATMAARVSLQLGDRIATDRYIVLALEATADRPPSRARAEALTAQTGFLMLGGRFEDAIRVGNEAQSLVEALGLHEQRARLHNYVGCARCCLGDEGGLAEIETSIAVAESAGAAVAIVNGYVNLSSELYFFGKLAESRAAENKAFELAERYGTGYMRRNLRASGATWAYADGRWDEALLVANELLALAQAGDPHYSDVQLLALRGWIEFARGDLSAAEQDTRRAIELARGSDLQAQLQAYCIGGSVALATGRREDADELASELSALGSPMVAGLCAPFPTLPDIAWLFHGLGRTRELIEVVLDPDPIKSPWNDGARAICAGELVHAADIIDRIGHAACAAYARLRAVDALATVGEDEEAATQRAQAEAFYRRAGAIHLIGEGEPLDTAPGDNLRASVDG